MKSADAQRRLGEWLDRPGLVRSPESLRRVRAIQALERIGSPAAQEVLRKLADGAPAAFETRLARLALERLKKRSRR